MLSFHAPHSLALKISHGNWQGPRDKGDFDINGNRLRRAKSAISRRKVEVAPSGALFFAKQQRPQTAP